MARVTVEDCIEQVPNRFELVIYAAQRARQISSGAPLLVERDNDKSPVISLREIAEGKFAISSLREAVIKGFSRDVNAFESDEELNELLAEEQEQQFEKNLLESSRSLEEVQVAPLEEEDLLEELEGKEDSLEEDLPVLDKEEEEDL
jgi:DNA-directed RNA polymerase subunit omega